MSNTCVCCGVEIPEGFQVCKKCLNDADKGVSKRDAIRSKLENACECTFITVDGVSIYKTAQGCYKVSSYKSGTSCLPLDLAIEVLLGVK